MRTHRAAAIAALLSLATLYGCNSNDRTDTAAEQSARSAARSADDTARGAGSAAEQAGDTIAQTADNIATTAKVKNSLMTTGKKLRWDGIDVDTSGGTVHLKGTVPTAQQKKIAEAVAAKAAGKEYAVMSHLEVAPSAP